MGAFASGVVYSLGGLALSSLNLYVFLQALASRPSSCSPCGGRAPGGRSLVWRRRVLAVALSTLALEFVGQAVLLGLVLGLAAAPVRAASGRVGLAILLGAGTRRRCRSPSPLGLLPESVRGAGFSSGRRAGQRRSRRVPAAGPRARTSSARLASPVEAWWGGAFFSKGMPYFLSLYLGPARPRARLGRGARAAPPRAARRVVGLAALALVVQPRRGGRPRPAAPSPALLLVAPLSEQGPAPAAPGGRPLRGTGGGAPPEGGRLGPLRRRGGVFSRSWWRCRARSRRAERDWPRGPGSRPPGWERWRARRGPGRARGRGRGRRRSPRHAGRRLRAVPAGMAMAPLLALLVFDLVRSGAGIEPADHGRPSSRPCPR